MADIKSKLITIIKNRYPFLAMMLRRVQLKKPFVRMSKDIKGSGNRIVYKGALLLDVNIDIRGNHNMIEIAEGTIIKKLRIFILGDHHQIRIGKNCIFSDRGNEIWIEDHHCALFVGDGCTFESAHLAITEPYSQIIMGNDCMLANDVDIRTGDSHSIIDAESGIRLNPAKNVEIANHVWIASHASVLKGAFIADNSIVATRSVVSSEFIQPNVLIAGVPAKIIKSGVSWLRERI